MPDLLYNLGLVLAETQDGEAAFMQFIRSAGRALSDNRAAAPLVGLAALALVVVLADWKLAGWLERLWRRKHDRRAPPRPTARPGNR